MDCRGKKKIATHLDSNPRACEAESSISCWCRQEGRYFRGSGQVPARQDSPLTSTLDLQPLNHPAMLQVFFEDFVDIFPVNIGVPDSFRIDDDDRALFTAVQTSRRVDSYAPLARKPQ